ncbi:MAG: thiamine pyrophosphate-binding protein [Gammaproteobacteria bacterium]|nr:thiamine pyrophosphate-binding protein [Gammaproteobacteria bacterium]
MSATPVASSGGACVVRALLDHAVDTVFCVPGESYLPVLDALYDVRDRIRLVSARHESGAAFMASAAARLRGRPGVVFVTRGPGATNASIAVHVARQGSIPLVVGVGQVARASLGREAFQEVDYLRYFAPLAKHVEQVMHADELPGAMTRAFHLAASGRPGPVVLALPEDVLGETTTAGAVAPLAPVVSAPAADDVERVCALLGAAERPLLVVGGNWNDADCGALQAFAAANAIPVMTAFRRQDVFDNAHSCAAGFLGYSQHAAAAGLAEQADCVVVLGARLDDPTTGGYTLWRDGRRRTLVHVHPAVEVLGRNYVPDLAVLADAGATAQALAARGRLPAPARGDWCERLNAAWRAAAAPPATAAALDPAAVMAALNARLDDDAIVCIDAGNFTLWPQRFRAYRRPGRLLGAVNGAMGHAVPAAVGAALSCPERRVVACVGDGGMLMTGQELATAAQYGARPLVLVFDNAKYGTIEMHQDRRYPGRRIGNALRNPDFAAMARAFGLCGVTVTTTAEIAPALDTALAADTAALVHLLLE